MRKMACWAGLLSSRRGQHIGDLQWRSSIEIQDTFLHNKATGVVHSHRPSAINFQTTTINSIWRTAQHNPDRKFRFASSSYFFLSFSFSLLVDFKFGFDANKLPNIICSRLNIYSRFILAFNIIWKCYVMWMFVGCSTVRYSIINLKIRTFFTICKIWNKLPYKSISLYPKQRISRHQTSQREHRWKHRLRYSSPFHTHTHDVVQWGICGARGMLRDTEFRFYSMDFDCSTIASCVMPMHGFYRIDLSGRCDVREHPKKCKSFWLCAIHHTHTYTYMHTHTYTKGGPVILSMKQCPFHAGAGVAVCRSVHFDAHHPTHWTPTISPHLGKHTQNIAFWSAAGILCGVKYLRFFIYSSFFSFSCSVHVTSPFR